MSQTTTCAGFINERTRGHDVWIDGRPLASVGS